MEDSQTNITDIKGKVAKYIEVFTHRRRVRWSIISSMVIFIVIILCQMFSGITALERDLCLRLGFKLRTVFNHSPPVSPRLKIIMLEDTSFAYLQRPDLRLDEWGALLARLDTQKPRHIFIDKLFTVLEDPKNSATQSFAILSKLSTPISVAVFLSSAPIPARMPVDVNNKSFLLKSYLGKTAAAQITIKTPPHLDIKKTFIYGPTVSHQKVFKMGHVMYKGDGTITALFKLSENTILPHITFTDMQNVKINNGELWSDGKIIPINSQGSVLINFLEIKQFLPNIISMKNALAKVETNENIENIKPGDDILILTNAFTGGTDFKNTPVGSIPGGFVLGSILNSRLTGNWLEELNTFHSTFILFTVAVITTLIGIYYSSFAILAMILSVFASIIVGLFLFIYANLHVPWISFSLESSAVFIAILGHRTIIEKFQHLAIQRIEQKLQNSEKNRKKLAKDIKDAAIMTNAFLPDKTPDWNPDYKVRAYHKPLEESSGDWFFFKKSPSGLLYHVAMCDITGHGVQAAIVVSCCKTALNMLIKSNPDTLNSTTFSYEYSKLLNDILLEQGNSNHTTTFVGITLEPKIQKAHCLVAANPFPLIINNTNASNIRNLGKASDVIGMNAEFNGQLISADFLQGETLIIYSDGVNLKKHRRILAAATAKNNNTAPSDLVQNIFTLEQTVAEDDVSVIFIDAL